MRFNRPFFLISGPPSIFSPRCVRRIASLEKRPKLRHWGLGQQFSPGCKTGHHKGKNANKNIHATNTKEQVQPVQGGSDLPNMQTGNRNHNSRYYKLPTI